jgi:oligopeptide/dipeptide ABC transporter ATP-binding protein
MYLGRIVETGTVRQVIRTPLHPYTQGLLKALPRLDDLRAELTPVPGDIPSPLDRPKGCVFSTRCPVSLGARCETEVPATIAAGEGRRVACHRLEPVAEGAAA